MKTMICLVLDRSGSMEGRQNDVIGGVNSFIEEQKKLPDPAVIAFVRFDTEAVERFRPMTNLAEVLPLSKDEYVPRGGTPLLDAIGKTIAELEEDWKREQPERAICVIITDGEENSSKEYKKAKIKELIQARQDSGKWAFIYLGANVDSFSEAGSMGFSGSNTANYQSTARGTKAAYATMSDTVNMMRATGNTLAANLGGDIEEDGSLLNKVTSAAAAVAQQIPVPAWNAPKSAEVWTPPA